MNEKSEEFISQRGQPSLEKITGKEAKHYTFKLLQEQYDGLETLANDKNISVAEYLRRLIAKDLKENKQTD